ncbi:MAG: hypothetical protein KJ002_11570 [Candidatus Dadabacteria bacterium]|nr:hypothetical protein [Candidatus Dadabacteria bacterium]
MMKRLHPAKLTLALALSLAAASCANMGRFTYIMNPEELSKEELRKLPYETTPGYGFMVGAAPGAVPDGEELLLLEDIDVRFTEFSRCFGITDGGKEVSGYLIAVVHGTFACIYHRGRCNGEYDPDYSLIIVTYKAFNRKGILPLLEHEWAHAYGILSSDHENLDGVKKCTRY